MRKRIVRPDQVDGGSGGGDWLDLEERAEVEITSEDPDHPIESALLPGGGTGWRAAEPGPQTLRLLFSRPQPLRRIWLSFTESSVARTQEYALRWSDDRGASFHEIVRQQWNFAPDGATSQIQDHQVELAGVTILELMITPHIGGGPALASLTRLRLA